MVASERAFAAASLEKGLHEAFLAYLAPDAIGFDPVPASGARRRTKASLNRAGMLTWGPAWVAVSSAGDLALSTGPWEFRLKEDAAIRSRAPGYFFSVWRRQPDGTWKVAVDAGISSPMTFAIPTAVENGFAGAHPGPSGRATRRTHAST